MTTVIMLLLLTGPFLVLSAWGRLRGRPLLDPATLGCIGVALMFCFTGLGHFLLTEPMAKMLPPWAPAPYALVYLTGVIEIAAGAAVLFPRFRRPVGFGLILMLILFLPVNVYAAIHRVEMGGHAEGPVYLWIRVPLQLFVLWWVWWFAVQSRRPPALVYSGRI